MANPTALAKGDRYSRDNDAIEVEQVIVNNNVVVTDQQSNVADLAQTVNTGWVRNATTVDSSAGGTAQTTACVTVPAQSYILAVEAEQTVAMDGDTTTTLEVGVTANPDQFIDTSDFDPSGTNIANSLGGTNNDTKVPIYTAAEVAIEALWTNTASASAGTTVVTVHYLPLANVDADSVDTKINAILDILENHGLMADA